ncbi:hypothetical protein DXG03_009400 [Asterophora parasitica]|uniref:C2H2-type domain-containing protein n=1 Tax=Asterophora parasitica TaxID=117018 RepID=A0A9P7GBI4_9AGAR|nr:hypothetical protein DXG03_009400 [Asterophora parasitica]
MLSNVLQPHPPHLLIPKYVPQGPLLARPNLVHWTPSFQHRLSPAHPNSPPTVEDKVSSTPSGSGNNYHYAHRDSREFDSVSPVQMYQNNSQHAGYSASAHSYHTGTVAQGAYDFINSDGTLADTSYLSESPSPVDPHPSSSYPQIISATHSQDSFSHSYLAGVEHIDAANDIDSDRYSPHVDNTQQSSNLLDHRRMSEPAILAAPNSYAAQSGEIAPRHRLQTNFNFNPPAVNQPRPSPYVHALQRGASMGSLREVRQAQLGYPADSQQSFSDTWKDDGGHRPQQVDSYHGADGLDGPISPLQPDFSGGAGSSAHGLPFSPTTENHYGSSPPGTGTSTSSIAPFMSPTSPTFPYSKCDSPDARDGNSKTYSFVALPGNTVKKRPRRRYDEIERLYQCAWPDCNKAYGTLNHLNAHVTMQKHGAKRSPNEFKELRKQWRKAKKETSPGPMRRSSISMRHDGHDYNPRRFDTTDEPNGPLYTRQPPYHGTSAGLPSSAPSVLAETGDRFTFPVDVNRYQVEERDDHLAAYSAHARQRYSGSTPSSWHGRSYMSSSLPSQSFAHRIDDNLSPLDTRMLHHPHHASAPHPRPHEESPSSAPMNRLPPDSTLLTPLPGYQPPSLLAPLHATAYSAEAYELYDDGHDGRPHSGHGSTSRSEEEY